MKRCLAAIGLIFLGTFPTCAQEFDPGKIREQVMQYKTDPRGPYRDIRWFCTDGSIRQPRDPCPDAIGPGWQHARLKPEVEDLAEEQGIYLGQILANTEPDAFWDAQDEHSRLKQYQMERYLKAVDNGWIHRRAQFYRGAVQAEDEAAWGREFFNHILSDDSAVNREFFLIRQALRDIPHGSDEDLAQKMRNQSKEISDQLPAFMDLRVKIHSQPEPADVGAVATFVSRNQSLLDAGLKQALESLLQTMRSYHRPIDFTTLEKSIAGLPTGPLKEKSLVFLRQEATGSDPSHLVRGASELLLDLREALPGYRTGAEKLTLLDFSLALEQILQRESPKWQPATVGQLMEKICYLGMAVAGSGYLELWEWAALSPTLGTYGTERPTLGNMYAFSERARSLLEWGTSMVKVQYADVVQKYMAFEPMAYGFTDDRIRSTILLAYGQAVGELGSFLSEHSGLRNQVVGVSNPSNIRGLNPGYALGTLEVIGETESLDAVERDRIYAFGRPPSDLKPVAGIATVSEGNMVSHVQLLARNLGIPNAALTDENLRELREFDGSRVFYAVSNRGTVLMKPESAMNETERALFRETKRSQERVRVPTDSLRLDVRRVLSLREVGPGDSGILCGPKAANLGNLKTLFPEQVVEGLVIPFGIFRWHMEKPMPGQSQSYWSFLSSVFKTARDMQAAGASSTEIETYQLQQLAVLRKALAAMEFHESFVADLKSGFQEILGADMGQVPVFLRSDTNMEDLKEFTGAGLNLTLFNVLDATAILEGIRAVWASPYTERSFKWRQSYLSNPENVFPSILIIPSVNVDFSGVLITKGVSSGREDELTLAFSRGAGGAVEGQAAEQHVLAADGSTTLIAPAREIHYTSLPGTGGTGRMITSMEKPILSGRHFEAIRNLAAAVNQKVSGEEKGGDDGPYDIELGFKGDTLWLFQIRPFVENKRALKSEYLESITPSIDTGKIIPTSTPLKP